VINIRSAAALLSFALMTASAGAQGINHRQKNQQKRIRQGVRSGELTRPEFRKLGKEQARIRRHEAKAKADGKLEPRERVRLQKELNKSSRHIYRQKHDNQIRKP